jgi:hypothetical protein
VVLQGPRSLETQTWHVLSSTSISSRGQIWCSRSMIFLHSAGTFVVYRHRSSLKSESAAIRPGSLAPEEMQASSPLPPAKASRIDLCYIPLLLIDDATRRAVS